MKDKKLIFTEIDTLTKSYLYTIFTIGQRPKAVFVEACQPEKASISFPTGAVFLCHKVCSSIKKIFYTLEAIKNI